MIGQRINCGKIYIHDESGEYKELGAPTEIELNDIEIDGFVEGEQSWKTNEVYVIPIYKEWYKKKKGNHFVRYYKIKRGFDPKIIKLLKGDNK